MRVLWRLGYQWQLPPPSSPVAPGRKCWRGDVFKELLKGINAFIRQPSPDHGTVLSQPLAGYIRDAVLCMLRRQDGNNVPMMSNYLSYYFSDIPVNMHMPIIVVTFTAAQKVAATHGDTLLPGDDERTTWARRSLTRWTHGLSGVEKSSPATSNQVTVRPVVLRRTAYRDRLTNKTAIGPMSLWYRNRAVGRTVISAN